MPPEMIEPFTQFGVAGLMGALWVWERLLSRRRERQLTESHEQLTQQRESLRLLMRLVHRNTQTIDRFEQTQQNLKQFLERVVDEINKKAV